MRPSRLVLSLALIGVGGLGLKPAHAEGLAEAIAQAYETNPGLLAQRAAMRSIDEQYVQARAAMGPTATASASETSYDNALSNGRAYANTHSEALNVQQPIYTGGRVTAQLNQAQAQVLAERETLRRYEQDFLSRVVQAYMNVRRDEQLLKVNRDTVTVLEKQVSDTSARFAVRENTMTDVAEAKARLGQARATLANAQGQLGISRATFISLVGSAPASLDAPPRLADLPATIAQALDAAEGNSPQLLSAQYAEQRSRARVAEARAGRLPTVTAQASFSHTPYIPYYPQPYNYAATATVTVQQPIFSSGQISSQIRQAVEQNNSDRLAIDQARSEMIAGVSSVWEQLAALRTQLKTLEDAAEADTFSFYGNREEEKSALRSTIDVLNAELELTQTQQALIRARSDEYVSQVQLLQAMGVLKVAMLSPGVVSYDPADNFRSVEHRGETPLEWPVRALDAIGQPTVSRPPPASLKEVRPNGQPMPPAPGPEKPLPSILNALDTPPPEPK
jgi:outer membrane protein/S-layer protein transport system outer membrane protein